MPSDDLGTKVELKSVAVHRQHCILGPVLAGKNPSCSVTFTDSIGDPDHARKGSMTYPPNAKGRAAAASAIASINADANAATTAPHVLLSPAPLVAATADNKDQGHPASSSAAAPLGGRASLRQEDKGKRG